MMNMAETLKLGEVSKRLKITNKDVIEKLAQYGVEVKSATSLITEDTAGLIIDIYTQANTVTEEEIAELRQEAIKKAEKEQAKKAAEEKAAAEKTEEKAEEKPEEPKVEVKKPEATAEPVIVKKAETKPAPKKAEKTPEKSASKQEKAPEKPRQEKRHKVAKKQTGQRIDLSNVDRSNTEEEFVVKTEEKRRVVDTRHSSVDLKAIETRERIENMVQSDSRMNKQGGKVKNKKGKNRREKENKKAEKKVIPAKVITEIEVGETIAVGELASRMGKTSAEIVKKLMMLGIMATQNQSVDYETAALVGMDFGIDVKQEVVVTKEDMLAEMTEHEDTADELEPRPPVVVVMGHVDHGKTSLLDAIRHTNVTEGEAGGITQHIGAYSVKLNDRRITFLDTPGHEAFTTMRARGAQVTDVAILVVAADDGIMPQTIEAINHAKAAGVQIVVAINKIDKDGANPDRVRQALVEYDLVPEEWGGDTVCVEISAKKRINIDGLLEMVLLVADMQELKANPNRDAQGTVIEAQIDKGRGPVATVLVQNGTLKVGDFVIAGTAVGRVRAMVNDKGRRVKTAGPSTPVELLGLNEAPTGGDTFVVVNDEKLARAVADQRKQEMQETKFNQVVKVSLDNLFSQIDEGNMKELPIVVKADVQGSVEAVKQSLEKLSNDEVRVKVIHGGVGAVNESDVMLANASNAIIVGFNVRPDAGAVASAEQQEVDIRLYRVIYQAIEEIEAAMKGMLDPEFKEVVLGYAEVRQTFKVSGVGTIAGCYVTQGVIRRNAEIRIVRDGIIIHEGKIDSLKRFKDDAKEVSENFECGLGVENFNDIKEGDTIECFVMEEIER